MEQAEEEYGERFARADDPQAPGRPGPARHSRPGRASTPDPQPDEGEQTETVKLETARRRRDRLAGQRADERDLAAGHRRTSGTVWKKVDDEGEVRALVIASSIPVVFSAGADIKAFTTDGRAERRGADRHRPTGCCASSARAGIVDDRRGQLARLRRRLRAGDGLRRPDRGRVGDLRPARDQARDHPRLRRHPAAAAAGRREQGARDEPDRRRDHRRRGASSTGSSTGSSPTTSCSTPRCRGRASSPARRRSRVEQIKQAPTRATSTTASRPRRQRLRRRVRDRGRQGGHLRLPRQARRRSGRASERDRSRRSTASPSSIREARLGRRADGRGDLGAVRDPRLPLARDRAVGEGRPDGGRPHRRLPARPRALLALLRRPLRDAGATSEPNARPRRARRARAPRPARRA